MCEYLISTPRVVASPSSEEWATLAAQTIGSSIRAAISRRGSCSLMLTGGNTAERLYNCWARSSSLPVEQMRFFFGDERCVPPAHADSNFGLVMRTLFANGEPPDGRVARMEAEDTDRDAAARRYEELLPEQINILLLGMGIDGHIASLFPHSEALCSTQRTVLPVVGPKSGHQRLSITPKVVANAESVFLLATGEEKGRVLAEAMKSPQDIMALPVRLALGGTWLMDDAAARQLS